MSDVPDRIRWAVDVINPGEPGRLLEVGCGPGVAAALVCARLTVGHLLATDRSAVAVGRTERRNADHVAAGRLTVRECALARLDVPAESVDTAFAINVNLFWTGDCGRELNVLRTALRPGGRLFVLYGPAGPTPSAKTTGAIVPALRSAGFGGVEPIAQSRGSGVAAVRP